jgi:hypothetical protein
MKRISAYIAIFAILTAVLACGKASPTATERPTKTSEVMGTATPAPSATPRAPNPCENVLYPLIPGNNWIYEAGSPGQEKTRVGLTVDKVDGSQAQVNALSLATGVVTKTTVECEAGAIKNYPAMSLNMILGNYIKGEMQMEYVTGVFAPAEAEFVAANWDLKWQGDYTAIGALNLTEEGVVMTATVNKSPVHMDWKTAGAGEAAYEAVTVPAGTYDRALKVLRDITIQADVSFEGQSMAGTIVIHTTQWFVPGIGSVKMQLDGGEVTYFGISLPILMQGTVELVEFRPAK